MQHQFFLAINERFIILRRLFDLLLNFTCWLRSKITQSHCQIYLTGKIYQRWNNWSLISCTKSKVIKSFYMIFSFERGGKLHCTWEKFIDLWFYIITVIFRTRAIIFSCLFFLFFLFTINNLFHLLYISFTL